MYQIAKTYSTPQPTITLQRPYLPRHEVQHQWRALLDVCSNCQNLPYHYATHSLSHCGQNSALCHMGKAGYPLQPRQSLDCLAYVGSYDHKFAYKKYIYLIVHSNDYAYYIYIFYIHTQVYTAGLSEWFGSHSNLP